MDHLVGEAALVVVVMTVVVMTVVVTLLGGVATVEGTEVEAEATHPIKIGWKRSQTSMG